ncbi:MAG: hypothetical protein ABI743_01695, partial [bacterium]
GSGDEEAVLDLAMQPSGNLVSFGYSRGAAGCDIDPGAGVMNVNFGAGSVGGCYLSFFNPAPLTPVFLNPSPIGWDDLGVRRFAVSPADGSIAVCGYNNGVDLDPTGGVFNPGGTNDPFAVRLTAAGGYINAVSYNTSGVQDSDDITLDLTGNVYWIGTYGGVLDFDAGAGSDTHTSVSTSDSFVTRTRPDLTWD